MADRYANQEEAMATEHDDRPRQNQKKDAAESSKQKDRKRKGDDMVAAAERSRPPRAPCTNDFDKVMESSCPFHPKGKHSAKDCFALKAYVERNSKTPTRDQDGPGRNPGQQQVGPVFPDPEHLLNMIYGGSDAYESKRKQKLPLGRSTLLLRLLPNISSSQKSQSLSAGPTIRTMFLTQDVIPWC